MSRTGSWLSVAIAVALAAGALAGCGSDTKSDSAPRPLTKQEERLKGLERHTSTATGSSTTDTPASSAPAAHAGPAGSSGRCAAGTLQVVSSGGQGAAGTQFASLRFELRGSGQCTLRGYPGVALLNRGRRLNANVGRYRTGQPRTVRVDARHPAYFDLAYRTTGNAMPGEVCGSRVTDLEVIPPDERRPLPVRLRPGPPSLCPDSVRVMPVRSTSALNGPATLRTPSGSSGSASTCGAGGSVYGGKLRITALTSRNVSCSTARDFARSFETKSGTETGFSCDEDFYCRWHGWKCRNDGRDRRVIDHRCVKSGRVVRWQARHT